MQASAGEPAPRRPRSAAALALLALAGLTLFLAFAGLGAWQLERRAWKLALIERVEQRLQAAPRPLPPRSEWPRVGAVRHEYLPVRLQGRWQADKTVLTQATTELGAGFWVLTPLALDTGGQVLVNRGFIPEALRRAWPARDPLLAAGQSDAPVRLAGLLRMSEPGGGFLRRNDPAAGRWHSRDVAAIAQAQGLDGVAPFFVDAGLPGPSTGAQAAPAPDAWPRPGMTVAHFRNMHLVYALTWWGLAALVGGGATLVARHELRLRALMAPGPAGSA